MLGKGKGLWKRRVFAATDGAFVLLPFAFAVSFLTLGAFVLGTTHADTRVTKWHFTPLVLLGSCIMTLGYEGSQEVTDFNQPLAAEVWPTPFAFTRNETADVFVNKKNSSWQTHIPTPLTEPTCVRGPCFGNALSLMLEAYYRLLSIAK